MSIRKRLIVGILLFVCGLSFACGSGTKGGDGDITTNADDTPPLITFTKPADSASEVLINSPVTAIFNEAMNVSDITTVTFTISANGIDIVGTVDYNDATATFTPSADLYHGTTYTAKISGVITDLAGKPIGSDYSWIFTTVAAPATKGWMRPGYESGRSYYYPDNTTRSLSNDTFDRDWTVSWENGSALTGDVTGDENLEVVYTSKNVLYVLDNKGAELWNIQLPEGGALNLLHDVTGNGKADIILSTKVNTTLKLIFYDGDGNFLKEISETQDVNNDNSITAHAVVDIDNDGDLEIVASRIAGYDLFTRGVELFDYDSGSRVWFNSIGPFVSTVVVVDVTGDTAKEILIGTGGPCNGHTVNGFSDCRSYAICWDKDGALLWSHQFEGQGFVDSEVAVDDLDDDGVNDVIYTSREHGWEKWDGGIGRIYLLNPGDGTIKSEYNAGSPLIVNGIADITGDNNKEIVVNYQNGSSKTGKILMFDSSLTLLDEYSLSDTRLRVGAINDLNGDGRLEILVRKMDEKDIVLLDNTLTELWSHTFTSSIRDVIPSDLSRNGVNEVLASTSTGLITLAADADKTPPVVVSTTPSNGAINVAVNSVITVTFSEAMDASTITTDTFTVSAEDGNIPGTVTYRGMTAIFSPSTNLDYSATCTVKISNGVKDMAGNVMETDFTWSFTINDKVSETITLPDTGQTKSYTDTQGEDSDYTNNPPSYTDNGDGTVTDNVTDLVWQKEDDDITKKWEAAASYCDNVTLGGSPDWRLPDRLELMTIVNLGTYNPSVNTTYFVNTHSSGYWSSDTYANDTDDAWQVDFADGRVSAAGKNSGRHVLCVRGGDAMTKSFTDNDNGTITDNSTGLMWQQGEGGSMTWEPALSYCEELSMVGYNDWRLPNYRELGTLVDPVRYNPALDITYFPYLYSPDYWSSTTDSNRTIDVWMVNFSNGEVTTNLKYNNGHVRCVRGGQ